jgi:hypothetical protein
VSIKSQLVYAFLQLKSHYQERIYWTANLRSYRNQPNIAKKNNAKSKPLNRFSDGMALDQTRVYCKRQTEEACPTRYFASELRNDIISKALIT